MTESTTLSSEPVTSPEKSSSFSPLLGLQGRLAIGGDALIPSKNVDLTGGIDRQELPQTVTLMSTASVKERKAYWDTQKEQTKEEQLSVWKKSVVQKITALPLSPLGKEQGEFFEKMGIHPSEFTENDAQKLYITYFAKEVQGQGLPLFLEKVQAAYRTASGEVDMAALKAHLPALEWMAGMFGGNSSELISQLLDTQIESITNPTTFVEERKDKVNNLSDRERELLLFLEKRPEVKVPVKTPAVVKLPVQAVTPPVAPALPKPVAKPALKSPIVTPPKVVAKPVAPVAPKIEQTPPQPLKPPSENDFLCLLANKKSIAEVDMKALVKEYQDNPISLIKKMQEKTAEVVLQMKKDKKSEKEIKDAINIFLTTQINLDHKAFPAEDVVKNEVPPYIPDGLSDMGGDNQIDDTKRSREKIRIHKEKMFENSLDLLYTLFTTEFKPTITQSQRELWKTKMVSQYIHNKIKYDYNDELDKIYARGGSVNADLYESLKLGVCRHHALDTQILLQSLGIDSRLLKSAVTFGTSSGNHGNNLVHIDNVWYLLDTTNPEYADSPKKGRVVYLKPLPEKKIDLNNSTYSWEFDEKLVDGTKRKRKYASRRDMFYRVRDNIKSPAPIHYVK